MLGRVVACMSMSDGRFGFLVESNEVVVSACLGTQFSLSFSACKLITARRTANDTIWQARPTGNVSKQEGCVVRLSGFRLPT